jgi:uncharacterized membrane protein YeaQ/YmgE (transglycosylase-associated protein family)
MIGALILGVVAGAIARAVVPNDVLERYEGWKSWVATIVLGLVGAMIGYVFFRLIGIGDDDVFDLGGIIGAIIGSVVVLLVAGWLLRRSAGTGRTHTAR